MGLGTAETLPSSLRHWRSNWGLRSCNAGPLLSARLLTGMHWTGETGTIVILANVTSQPLIRTWPVPAAHAILADIGVGLLGTLAYLPINGKSG